MPATTYDNLDEALGIDPADPQVIAERDDIRRVERLRRTLIESRATARIRQSDVAERMGTTQSRVSALESCGSNPRISTLQRYARAIGGHLALAFVVDRAASQVVSATMRVATTASNEPMSVWSASPTTELAFEIRSA